MINIHEPNINLIDKFRILKSLFNKQIGKSKKVNEFENNLKQYLKLQNILTTNSATQGLFEIFKLLKEELYESTNVRKYDKEIIISSMSYIGIASAIKSNDFKIKYCDINKDYLSIDLDNIKKSISKKTHAVVLQHYGGRPNYETKKIYEYLKSKNIYLIEDCATVLGGKLDNLHLGSFSDFSVWSFDPNKSITSLDGGAIHCKNINHYDKIKNNIYLGINDSPTSYNNFIVNKDEWWKLNPMSYGSRNVLNEVCATLGISQLKRLNEIINRQNEIWNFYFENIKNKNIVLPKPSPLYINESGFLFWIHSKNRNELAKYLKQNNIYSTFRYYPLHKTQLYKSNTELLITEKIYNEVLCIPCHKNLTKKELKYIVKKINEF